MPNDGFEPEQANMSVSQDPHHTSAKLQWKKKKGESESEAGSKVKRDNQTLETMFASIMWGRKEVYLLGNGISRTSQWFSEENRVDQSIQAADQYKPTENGIFAIKTQGIVPVLRDSKAKPRKG